MSLLFSQSIKYAYFHVHLLSVYGWVPCFMFRDRVHGTGYRAPGTGTLVHEAGHQAIYTQKMHMTISKCLCFDSTIVTSFTPHYSM